MKFPLIFLFVFYGITSWSQSTPAELIDKNLKISPTENCTISYEISGDAQGKAFRYVTSWGWKERYEMEMVYSLFGLETTETKLTLRDGLKVYKINPSKNEGRVTSDQTIRDLLAYKSLEETIEAVFINMGGTKKGTDTLLGKEVNIWKFDKGATKEVWEWKGIVLKEVKSLQDLNYVITASDIHYNEIENINFQLPENIKLIQE